MMMMMMTTMMTMMAGRDSIKAVGDCELSTLL